VGIGKAKIGAGKVPLNNVQSAADKIDKSLISGNNVFFNNRADFHFLFMITQLK
jgi:maltoporin